MVCGLMQITNGTITELIEKPRMSASQIASWEATLKEAREMLRLGHISQETLESTRGLVR